MTITSDNFSLSLGFGIIPLIFMIGMFIIVVIHFQRKGSIPIHFSEDGIPVGIVIKKFHELPKNIDYRNAKSGRKVPKDVLGVLAYIDKNGNLKSLASHSIYYATYRHLRLSNSQGIYILKHRDFNWIEVDELLSWVEFLAMNGIPPVNIYNAAHVSIEIAENDIAKFELSQHYTHKFRELISSAINFKDIKELDKIDDVPGAYILKNVNNGRMLISSASSVKRSMQIHLRGHGDPNLGRDIKSGHQFKFAYFATDDYLSKENDLIAKHKTSNLYNFMSW